MKRNTLTTALLIATTGLTSVTAFAAAETSDRFSTQVDSAQDRTSETLLRGVIGEEPTLIRNADQDFSSDSYQGAQFAPHSEKILKPINDSEFKDDLYAEYIENLKNDDSLNDSIKDDLLNDDEWSDELLASVDSSNSLGCAYESTESITATNVRIMRIGSKDGPDLLDYGNTRQACVQALSSSAKQRYESFTVALTEAHSAMDNTTHNNPSECRWGNDFNGGSWLRCGRPDEVTCEGIVTGVLKN